MSFSHSHTWVTWEELEGQNIETKAFTQQSKFFIQLKFVPQGTILKEQFQTGTKAHLGNGPFIPMLYLQLNLYIMFSLYFATKYDPSYQNSAPADSDTSFLHAVSEVTISLQMRRWRCKTVTDKSARSKEG